MYKEDVKRLQHHLCLDENGKVRYKRKVLETFSWERTSDVQDKLQAYHDYFSVFFDPIPEWKQQYLPKSNGYFQKAPLINIVSLFNIKNYPNTSNQMRVKCELKEVQELASF